MGFFKSITRAITRPIQAVIKNPVKAVTSVANTLIKDPVRGSLAVLTSGGSEILRNAPVVGTYVQQGTQAASNVYKTAANVYTGGAYGLATNIGQSLTAPKPLGGNSMALNLGGIFNQVGTIFGQNQNPYFQTIGNIATLAGQFTPTYISAKQPGVAVPAPMPRGPMQSVGTVARGFFNKYPALAVSMQMLRNQGRKVKRSQLYAMLKRFGPEVLITGGILTAAAVSELMVAGPGHRRMNPGNVKALRRSMRRLESFHHLCQRADKLRKPRARACKK